MKLLVGLSRIGREGGISVTERRFLDECRKQSDVIIRTFEFGSRVSDESVITRIVGRLWDVAVYAWLLIDERPDIVHINSSFDKRALLRDVWYALVSKLFRRRLFIKLHGSDAGLLLKKSIFWRLLAGTTISNASAIGVLSNEEMTNFTDAGFEHRKFFTVKNAVDVERFSSPRPASSIPQLLFIGRFIRTKGLIETIEATNLLLKSGEKAQLLCVGDGPQKQDAEALVREVGLASAVRFTGHVSEAEATRFYLESSVLVFPTFHDEGFSMALFQALAAGLPIITTRIRAAADYLKEPDNCFWVEPRNPEMLAEKTTLLLHDPNLGKQMSANNRELAKRFAPDVVAQEYLTIFNNLLATGV